MIESKIILDSINPDGQRITTYILKFPRFILAEFNTHRALSRNAASSRAIPSSKMIDMVQREPASPEYWGSKKKGMSSGEELEWDEKSKAFDLWYQSCKSSIEYSQRLANLDLHKSITNRIIEPYFHVSVLCTATEYTNFFRLRAHPAAQPEFQVLAYKMLGNYLRSDPIPKKWHEWHIPFGNKMPDGLSIEDQLKIATARAARVSYFTFDNIIDTDKDFELHDGLIYDNHMSPLEHCAIAKEGKYANFAGWKQYRKIVELSIPISLKDIWNNRPNWIRNYTDDSI